jgi:hypothetical protein
VPVRWRCGHERDCASAELLSTLNTLSCSHHVTACTASIATTAMKVLWSRSRLPYSNDSAMPRTGTNAPISAFTFRFALIPSDLHERRLRGPET